MVYHFRPTMPKGVSNKGKSITKKKKTPPQPTKLKKYVAIVILKVKTSKTPVRKEMQEEKMCHRCLQEAGLIPKDPNKSCKFYFM